MSPSNKQILIVLAVALAVVAADQVTKTIVIAKIPEGSVWPEDSNDGRTFFHFVHRHNTGMVGGLGRNMPWLARLAPLAASAVLVYLYRHIDRSSKLHLLAYGMVAGGAVGNLIDRFRLGWVTDFLQFHFYFIPFDFPWKHYPAFNVADSGICVGVFLLVAGWHIVAKKEQACASQTH